MARLSIPALIAESERLWSRKAQFDTLVAECYEHALPDRNPYAGTGTGQPQGRSKEQGADRTSRRVLDSTLQADAAKLANRIQYELFPIGHEWASFVPGPFIAGDAITQARGDLHRLQKLVFTALQFSNFDLSIAEWLLELIVAGTACMFVDAGDEDNPVIYQTVCQSHVAFRTGAFGKIDFISRKYRLTPSIIKATWPDAKGVDALAEVNSRDGKEPELDLIEVSAFDYDRRRWSYSVVVTGGAHKQEQSQIVDRDYALSPWVIARWSKAAEEDRGRSLVMAALPDARVLSAVKGYLLRHAALAVAGAFMVRNDGTVNANTVRIFPGAMIPVRSTGGPAGASIEPLRVGGDMNLAQFVMNELVTNIHRIMLNDGVPEIRDGQRTATEFMIRMKELQQSLGAPFSRILKEGIVPILESTIAVLARAGVIPVDPQKPLRLNSGKVQVRFSSPLVQGQALREIETAQQAMAITAQFGGGEQAVALNFMVEDFGAWVANTLGVVPELIRPKQSREQLQQQAGAMIGAQMGGVPGVRVGGNGGVAPIAANQQQQAAPMPLAA